MNILVCGFMGSGKTTFCSSIKKHDPWKIVELDSHIEKIENLSVAQIFSERGEKHFRKIEYNQLCSLLESDNLLISLGGGSLTSQVLEKIKSSEVKTIFLNTPFEICFSRIEGSSTRPLASINKNKLKELYDSRLKLYKKADLMLAPDQASLVESITELVNFFSP